jgi:MscS family membrane protein
MNEITIIDYQFLAGFFIVAIILHFVAIHILALLTKGALKTKTKLDDYIITAFNLPLKLSIWLIFAYTSLEILIKYYPNLTTIISYINLGFIIILTIFLVKVISQIEKYFINENTKFDNDIVRLISKISKVIVIFLLTLSMLQFIGVNISSILAFGGVGGIIIGMAAKDMLANIFGGLMISLDRPFSVGDWIRIGSVEGTVEEIGWRITKVRTFSKNPIYVPNSMFSTGAIETPSRMTNRRIREVIGVRYEDIAHISNIISNIKQMLEQHPDIDKTQTMDAYFEVFNASSLDIVIVAFTTCTDKASYQVAKSDILLKIASIIAENDADFAYPTQTLHIQKE